MGDVIGLVDASGNLLARYDYEPFGALVSVKNATGADITDTTHIAHINPIRYRSYYYDRETGLYYLQTRYYDPKTGRFINADSISYLGADGELTGYNLYTYCGNNPIARVDPSGKWIETVFDLLSLGVSVVEVVINPLDPWAWAGLGGDALDLIPFVTGLGEGVKGMRVVAKGADLADDALDAIRFTKAVDFTDDAWDTIKSLDRVGDFTASSASAGRRIHTGYKVFGDGAKEIRKFSGIRPDFLSSTTIFELKPYNRRSLRAGVNQLLHYKNVIGQEYFMVLEFY